MCRFLMYMGEPVSMASLVTEPENSLIKQSYMAKERPEPLNGDGFGVAWYAPNISPKPAVFKSITPAWNNENLLDLARVTLSPCILAHVRAATSSTTVTMSNCHPFTWREMAFCHNGDIGGFQNIRRKLLSLLSDEAFNIVKGNTDSEHMFALYVDHFLRIPDRETNRAASMATALSTTIKDIAAMARAADPEEHCYINCAVTDGIHAVVAHCSTDPTYIDSLHIFTGERYACVKGRTQIISKQGMSAQRIVLVASEPLTQDQGWHNVGLNKIMAIDADRSVISMSVKFEDPPATAVG